MKKRMILTSALISMLSLLPAVSVQAATVEAISSQVTSYVSAGAIWDADFGNAVLSILASAKAARNAGNEAGKASHLDAFSITVYAASGDLLSVDAATTLAGMVP